MKKIVGYCLLMIGLVACDSPQNTTSDSRVTTLPYYEDASFTPLWLNPKEDAARLNNFHQIPSFKLTNQNGEVVTEKKFKDKIYVTDFFFTSCPGICPKMTSSMKSLQEAFLDNPNVLLLSHSVTPKHDSVPILLNYATVKGIQSSKWDLVTGERSEIYNLGRNFYFVEEDLGLEKDPDDFLHTENFVLVDYNRHIRGIYNGLNKASIQQLISDIKTLEKELL